MSVTSLVGSLHLGLTAMGWTSTNVPPRKGHRPLAAADLGHALQPRQRLHRLLCRLGDVLLPERPFATIKGFISEIICFPMTENIKF